MRDLDKRHVESQSKILSFVQLVNRYEGLRIQLLNHCKMMEVLIPEQLKSSEVLIPPSLEIKPLENETTQRLLEPFEYLPQVLFPAVERVLALGIMKMSPKRNPKDHKILLLMLRN